MPSMAHDTKSLVPRSLIFADPDHANPRVSPDGMHLSFLAAHDGVMNIFVSPIDNPAAARPVTRVCNSGLWEYHWSPDSDALIYPMDEAGNERWHIFRVRLSDGDTLNLTPTAQRAFIERISRKH